MEEMQQMYGYGGGYDSPQEGGVEAWDGGFGAILDPELQLRKRRQQLQDNEQKAVLVHNAIMARSRRKCARVLQLRQISEPHEGPQQPPLSTPSADEPRRIQQQVLVDVSSARARKKQAFIREQLRKNMVTRQIVKPAYGEAMVFEFPFVNPYSHEMVMDLSLTMGLRYESACRVFELRISSPSEVSVLSRAEEYHSLKAANVRVVGSEGVQQRDMELELMGGNRLYMRANERVVLPLKVQSLHPPQGFGPPTLPSAAVDGSHSAALQPTTSTPTGPGRLVSLDIVSASHGHSVGVLELQIAPQPLIIDRTFRFSHPERELMRQVINLSHLSGGAATTMFSGPAARSLTAAASHPNVVTGAGSSPLAGGPGTRDEVFIKYKCGPAPEVTHFYVVLYGDRLLARPIEVWQVFVHSLRKVDMRAMIGQTSVASVVLRGAMVSRRVGAYATHPDELQVAPDSFVLVAGALTEVLLTFKPVMAGPKDIKVHIVDIGGTELVSALTGAVEELWSRTLTHFTPSLFPRTYPFHSFLDLREVQEGMLLFQSYRRSFFKCFGSRRRHSGNISGLS
ncbi:hypothetical protein DUNSADRAFT_2093 [Dunaliella salina]|uniref:Uncharacterized protein n=1 Tax=Dunaliella salina TaxID=3046 RepID=A0ABQ7GW97_DUNSA|nr:hypothetical protein DUNSADRAFT_2093 [Dunaliella salina]|eukprot:KAF5838835.1 hypothetical protein DUNSADRAFT_2093 [Dunaliella salina]